MASNGRVLGASVLVYHKGQEKYYNDVGVYDREAKREWTRDTLVNIYSMTKPVTGVTLMTLYEEGLFKLDDPVSQYLPEFDQLTVYTGQDPLANGSQRPPPGQLLFLI